VQLSRHPSRPHILDHVKALCGDTFELHRTEAKDDKAMIGGLRKLVVSLLIVQQKDTTRRPVNTENFGMANQKDIEKHCV
jgi:acetyl-CoA carboxylase carboxyl transferase subunit alpha